MFRLAKTVPYWLQLLRTSPVLAFIVARCWHFDGLSDEGADVRIRKYVGMKRVDICAALGFPGERSTVRILTRVQIWSDGMVPMLLLLRALLLWEPSARDILERKKLSGEYIGPSELRQLAIGDKWGDLSLFEKTAELAWFFLLPAAKRHSVAENYKTVALKNGLNDVFLEPVKPLAYFRNERSAVSYITNYRRQVNIIRQAADQLKKRIKDFTWPEPPIPATDSIIPILSNEDLEKEGQNLRHCVASYSHRILLGEYYVYRVDGSSPCTLGVNFVDGSWEIDQIKGKENRDQSDPHLLKMVNSWLHSVPRSTRDTSSRMDYLQAISRISGFPIRSKVRGARRF